MRICHVSPHLPPDQAANAILPAQLGAWARARGDDVAFVAMAPSQGREGDDHALAGPVARVTARRSESTAVRFLRIDTWTRTRAVTDALARMAADADLLHLHSNGLIVEVAAAWAARRGVPYVLTLYGTEIWHYRRRRPIDPFRRAYFGAAAVTFYSQGLLDRARELGLDRAGLETIYPAVNPAFAPADADARAKARASLGIGEPLVILNVKRLHELAGQRFLIEAFARIARRRADVRLVICGTGPLKDALVDQAHREGVADRVTFTGLVGNDRVAAYAAAADVFVLPSLLEALPTVAVEALAAGTPVVSADHPGGVELHGLFGDDVRVVPRENVDALEREIDAALASSRRVAPATRRLVDERFSPAAIEAAYNAVYARIGRDRGHSRHS
jgi:glycosyltransferase involved in cell wall biosynthesis